MLEVSTRSAPDFLAGGGELGALMRSHDWERTPLGAPRTWPQSLRTSVSTCLNCSFPILLWWGPELIKLYNDAYKSVLGNKHPAALGARGKDVWREIWPTIGPMLERVLHHGEATPADDLLLMLERYGYAEESYFSFSYSPIRDESGGVGGVFCPVIETTGRVLGARRLNVLSRLGAETANARSAPDACMAAAGCLADAAARDLPFAAFYVPDVDDKGIARLCGTVGCERGGPLCPETIAFDPAAGPVWPFDQAARAAEPVVVADLKARFGAVPRGPWQREPDAAIVLPIGSGAVAPPAFMVAGLNPHRPAGEVRDFASLIAAQLATAIANAVAYETERHRAEALARIDRAKTAFFSNVSHEFRTPLTLMLGPLEQAFRRSGNALEPALREDLELVHRNALRLQKLVNALLDFSRVEAGRAQARFAPTDLAALTVDLASGFRSACERAGIRLIVDCDPLRRPAYIDRGLWEKIVLNLLSNALKFTFEGGITVRLRADDNEAVLAVEDTGVGIPAAEMAHLFERFHRIAGQRSRTHEGSGIGLALVQELVGLHGGTIEADSEEGRGTCFTVRVPLGAGHLSAEYVSDASAPLRGRQGELADLYAQEALGWLPSDLDEDGFRQQRSSPVSEARARILVADDNADMRAYVARLLDRAWDVETVADGEAALAALRARPPDLVLSDVMMPGLDGFALVRAIRADPAVQDLPIILLSARAGEEARIEGLDAGADDYVAKPFSADELRARVRANLAIAELRRQAVRAAHDNERRLLRLNETLEARVAERTAERDQLWELSEDMLVIADYDGHLLRVAPAWTRALGWDEQTLLTRPYQEIIHPDDLARVMRALSAMRRSGQPIRLRNRLLASDGTWRTVSWALSPDPHGSRLHGVGRDITAELAQEAALDAMQEQLHQAQKLESIGQLTGGIAHDFNNLLAAIRGGLELIGRRVAQGRATEVESYVQGALAATERGAALTHRLLAFARRQALDPKPVAPDALIGGMIELIRRTVGPAIEVDTHLNADGAYVVCDANQLESALLNLVINARDAMPAGGRLQIFTDRTRLGAADLGGFEEPGEGDYVQLCVSDTGVGMTPDVRARAFEPFFTTKPTGQGTGLGLSQIYGFVRQSDGLIRLVSTPGQGTTAHILLPRRDGPPAEGHEAPARPEIAREAGGVVLLVEDEPGVRAIAAEVLREIGCTVLEAADGPAATAVLRAARRVDVLVTDVGLPGGMNGRQIADAARERRPDLPVLFITGYAGAALADWTLPPGMEVIGKPYALDAFAGRVAAMLKGGADY